MKQDTYGYGAWGYPTGSRASDRMWFGKVVGVSVDPYVNYLKRKLARGEWLLGRTAVSASARYLQSSRRRPREFTESGSFNAADGLKLQSHAVKRLSHTMFAVFDLMWDIPITEPLALDEACKRCQEMNTQWKT